MTLPDIENILQELARDRPVFHAEADFQHALAWLIHQHYPDARVRLEVNPYTDGQRAYIDILLRINDQPIAIELKYKTKKTNVSIGGEDFHLLDQSAQDIGRYDFIKDISRLERFVLNEPSSIGYAIFLSNDPSYWMQAKRADTVDGQFRMHQDTILKGKLEWGELASAGTRRGREKVLSLDNEYPLLWQDYSQINDSSAGQLKYILLEIRSKL